MSGRVHGLDDIDREILQLVQTSGKLTMQEISKSVGNISKVAVSYRLKKLEDMGIIEGYYAKLDPEKLDRGYIVISRMICKPKGQKATVISNEVAKFPGVQSMYGVFGRYDFVFIARTANKEAAKNLIAKVNDIRGVVNTETIVAHTAVKESLAIDIPSTLNRKMKKKSLRKSRNS